MPDILVQARMPYFSGVPEDVAINTWSFEINDDTEINKTEVVAALGAFYTDLLPFYSPVLDLSNLRIVGYDRADPEPRSPIIDAILNIGNANTSNDALPEECAVCLSFRGVNESGEPPARRRGRVFLGPLATDVVVAGAASRTLVSGTFREAIRDAYWLFDAELSIVGNNHTVWSTADGVARVVTELWVDNAFDTQRRRGQTATSRLTFPRSEP